MNEDNRIFKVTNPEGQEVELYIKNPTLKENQDAKSVYNKTWNRALNDGAILSEKLNTVLKEQGIWNDDKEEKLKEVKIEIAECLNKIDKGGIKLSEAKALALRVRELRDNISALTFDRLRYINNTVEGQASNEEHNYLSSQLAVYNNNRANKYFKNYEDYLNRSNDLDAYFISNKVAEVLYGGNDESYPEVKFLKEYKFVNDKLQFVNKEGHTTDLEGRLTDEEGYYIKYGPDGQKIRVDKEGNPVVEQEKRKPFLDDNGVEIKNNVEEAVPS